jgi:hypothetical protein
MLMERAPATTRWLCVTEITPLVMAYFERHKDETFLVKLDRGHGAGMEYDTMRGRHIIGAIKYRMRTKVYATARIYPFGKGEPEHND